MSASNTDAASPLRALLTAERVGTSEATASPSIAAKKLASSVSVLRARGFIRKDTKRSKGKSRWRVKARSFRRCSAAKSALESEPLIALYTFWNTLCMRYFRRLQFDLCVALHWLYSIG
ncbi:hypothetical protein [Thiorhodovibrio frisius]|uniref:hypothetical protein n=1 Tax=Thiorhodovibrio frisius TaxID=631362 RepID=UPI00117C9865|nr:hypothetical protein [Thiorhodovibrio frisius]